MTPDEPVPSPTDIHAADGIVGSGSAPAASRLVAACEEAWRLLQRQHPEIPDAVIVLGTGVERGRLVKLGHWWGGQWIVDQGRRAEVLLAGEALHLTADAVFEVLVHEAAHGINAARGIQDTSRGGRYHNARFKAAAEALGLTVTRLHPYGWAATTLDADARVRHAEAIAVIAAEMRLARHVPATRSAIGAGIESTTDGQTEGQSGRQKGRGSGQPVTATCGCGRRLRMAPTVLAAGPVSCGRCGSEFAAPKKAETAIGRRPAGRQHPAEPTSPAAAPLDRSFMARRREALAAEDPHSEPFAEGLRHLEAFEAALVDLSNRNGDAEARRTLEVFRDRRPEILDWLGDVTTATVVAFPVERIDPPTAAPSTPPRCEAPVARNELDLRSIELGCTPPPVVPVATREPPAPEVGA